MFALIVDEEITLRLFETRHAEALYDLADANREHISQWLNWMHRVQTLDDMYDRIISERRRHAQGEVVAATIWYRGHLAGDIRLKIESQRHHSAAIGYWLGREFTGRGIMTRCVRAITDYAIADRGLNRITIFMEVGNERSRAIPQRLGFVEEGLLRQEFRRPGNRFTDTYLYSIVADEWTVTHPAPHFRHSIDAHTDLRLMERHHADLLADLTQINYEHIAPWLSWVERTRTADDAYRFIERALRRYGDENGFLAGVWYKNRLVGGVDYHEWDFRHLTTEIGYWLARHATGRGIISRCVAALVDYAVDELGLNRIVINAASENHKSRAIPQRLGFTHEATQRQAQYHRGRYLDWELYTMLADDWRQRRQTHLYHIAHPRDWAAAQLNGLYRASSLDAAGFIHASTAAQVLKVANALYRDAEQPLLLVIDTARLDVPVKWEAPHHPDPDNPPPTEARERFPHIYGPIPVEAVAQATPLPLDRRGFFVWPPDLLAPPEGT